MIDSHCHLADTQFDHDRSDVIQRALDAGISSMICIADSIQESEKCIQIAETYEQIFCTVGVHPHESSSWDSTSIAKVRQLIASSARVKALGEMGLDYYYNHAPAEKQIEAFEEQLRLAKECNLPAVVHCRDALEDVRQIITDIQPQNVVIHCCTEPWERVEELVKHGYMLSFTGIATYKKSDAIRDTILQCPLEQMMIETDAPYLAPVPHRGKRNEPAFVVEVVKTIADVKRLSLEEVQRVTTANAVRFFDLHS